MALAVVMVACPAATPGKPGDPGKAGPAGEPGGVPPDLETEIGAVTLVDSGARATHTINLDDHFWDPDDENAELTYDPSSSNEEVVTAVVTGRSTLTLTASGVGMAKITVTATDADDLSRRARFDVTVVETGAPMPTQIPNKILYKDDGAQTIDLSVYFKHERPITYTAVASPEGIIETDVEGATLTLTPVTTNQARVTVTATADGKAVDNVFTVDVMAGNAPMKPVAEGEITDKVLTVGGDPISVPVVDNFRDPDGDELMYSAESDDNDVATAMVAAGSSSVTVTPKAEGEATITVTATDPGGLKATQMFDVMVNPAEQTEPDEPESMTVTIEPNEKDKTIDLSDEGYLPEDADPAEYELGPLSTSVFKISPKSDSTSEWVITPVRKGSETAHITPKAGGDAVNTITIIVRNRPPKRKLLEAPTTLATFSTAEPPYVNHPTIGTANNEDPKIPLKLYQVGLDAGIASYFEDLDQDALTYKVDISPRGVALISSGSPCNNLPCNVWVDVLQKKSFNFMVTAVDGDEDGESEPLMIPATAKSPASQAYNVIQQARTRAQSITVGYRPGVNHGVTFKGKLVLNDDGTVAPSDGPLQFAEEHRQKIFDLADLGTDAIPSDAVAGATIEYDVRVPDNEATSGASATGATVKYTVQVRPVVELPRTAGTVDAGTFDFGAADTSATLDFRVTGVTSGQVIIGYHIWYDQDGDGTKHQAKWHSDHYTLTVRVTAVN